MFGDVCGVGQSAFETDSLPPPLRMSGSLFANPETRPPLDESLYPIKSEEDLELLRFLQNQIGIQDEEELKQHVLRVQAKAYDIYGYPCIRGFSFLRSVTESFSLEAY